MNNENYIVINGKKTELTEEQLKQLGIDIKPERNNPFDVVQNNQKYYYIDDFDNILYKIDLEDSTDVVHYNSCNYFNDKNFVNQTMLHQQLYRKLLRYAYDNNAEDYEWNNDFNHHYYIYFDYNLNRFRVAPTALYKNFCVYFSSAKVAEQAIKDVVEPFMKEHPEFVW